jgi:hypothetical protein
MTRYGTESGDVSCALQHNLRRAMLQTWQISLSSLCFFLPIQHPFHSSTRHARQQDGHDQIYIISPAPLVALYLLGHSITSNMFHSSHEHHILWPHQMCYRYRVCNSYYIFIPQVISLLTSPLEDNSHWVSAASWYYCTSVKSSSTPYTA